MRCRGATIATPRAERATQGLGANLEAAPSHRAVPASPAAAANAKRSSPSPAPRTSAHAALRALSRPQLPM